jgi:hypothetical protein
MTEDYPDDDDEGPPCPRCDGFRMVSCHCGGDQCYCHNYGERDCPLCYGEGVAEPKRAEAYLAMEREMAKALRKWWAEERQLEKTQSAADTPATDNADD